MQCAHANWRSSAHLLVLANIHGFGLDSAGPDIGLKSRLWPCHFCLDYVSG